MEAVLEDAALLAGEQPPSFHSWFHDIEKQIMEVSKRNMTIELEILQAEWIKKKP